MRRFYSISLLLWQFVCFIPVLCKVNNSSFVPSHEWQTIKEGQAIPAGLHVRINLETGKKEAKLMEDDKSSSNELAKLPGDYSSSGDGESNAYLSDVQKRLKEALKKIPSESVDETDERLKEIREKYKDYKELKKEFESVNMDIKTDSEIINSLLNEYKNGTKDTARALQILDDLDYLVHQIDNALWFIDSGGLDAVVVPTIVNGTDTNLKTKCLRLLGALIHNNPKAQIRALEKNCGNYLSQILLTSKDNGELSAAVYAFGSLLRKFPFAQKENLPKTGMKALLSVLGKKNIELRTKVKVLTLVSDMFVEQKEALNSLGSAGNDEGIREKQEQYKNVQLDTWLHEENFCEMMLLFVVDNHIDFGKEPDVLDHLLDDVNTTAYLCLDVWSQSQKLQNAMSFLKNLFHNMNDDEFLTDIEQKAILVHKKLFSKHKFEDEL